MQIFLDWFILMNSMHMLYYTYMILTINKCSALLEIIYQRERVDLFGKEKKVLHIPKILRIKILLHK